MPAHLLSLSITFAVDQRSHPVLIKTFRLDQVDYVVFISLVFSSIGHAEVKPLRQRYRTPVVKFKIEIIFKISYLGCFVEVTRFKPGFKN